MGWADRKEGEPQVPPTRADPVQEPTSLSLFCKTKKRRVQGTQQP